MKTLLRVLSSLLGRLRRVLGRMVSVVVTPVSGAIGKAFRLTRAAAPRAMSRHRQRACRDRSYAKTVGDAVTALLSTIFERPTHASVLTVFLSAWLGTPDPTGASGSSAKIGDSESADWSHRDDPIPLWDRLQLE